MIAELYTGRRPRYHRARDRGPWLLALRRLHAREWSDREIAETISDLSASAIARLERLGLWNWRAVEAAQAPGSGGLAWTPRQVRYHRRQLDLDGYRGHCEEPNLLAARRASDREYQRRAGWGHLLPAYDERHRRWLAGHELRRREVDILSALRDLGPLTRAGLCRALGVTNLHTGGRSYLRRLRAAGLVYRHCRRPFRYTLTLLARRLDPLRQWQELCRQA